MSRPLLVDLFCCEGGAATGYRRAGFDILGVDIDPQPNYPYTFLQADAVTFLERGCWRGADAIHASPPCQRHSTATQATGDPNRHPDLIAPVRALLETTGLPYVIENVEGAPLRRDITLCGSMFGMQVRRHRVFELGGWMMLNSLRCRHGGTVVDVTGHAGGHNQSRRSGFPVKYYDAAHAREVMGMPWASGHGCVEAIPPAYTEHIGRQLIAHLDQEAAA